jgi:class 3 adenylate cyclase
MVYPSTYTAIVVVFKADSSSAADLKAAVNKATESSLRMLNTLDHFVVDKDLSLRLHLGIGCGKIYGLHVGGHNNRWEYFAAGPALGQLKYALDSAQQGEVGLSREAWEHARDQFPNFERRGDPDDTEHPESLIYVLTGTDYAQYKQGATFFLAGRLLRKQRGRGREC